MMKFDNIEFYSSPEGEIMIKHNGEAVRDLTDSDTEIINHLFERIRKDYTEAFDMASKIYDSSSKNFSYFRYLVVRRFIRCNFSNYDTLSEDIDGIGMFHFEQVQCPLRGECPGYNKICNPKFNTTLSNREKQILELYCIPMEMDAIAGKLFISPDTVDVHLRHIRSKLNLHSKAELVKFWETRMK